MKKLRGCGTMKKLRGYRTISVRLWDGNSKIAKLRGCEAITNGEAVGK
jgi:hypothetical protein